MAFQKQFINNIADAIEGDTFGNTFYSSPTRVVNDANGIKVGKPVYISGDDALSAISTQVTNSVFLGFAARRNTNVSYTLGFTENATLTIPNKQNVEVLVKGGMYVKIDTIQGANPVKYGDIVYIKDNKIVADGGGIMTGFKKTPFRFVSKTSELTLNSLVKITNDTNDITTV